MLHIWILNNSRNNSEQFDMKGVTNALFKSYNNSLTLVYCILFELLALG